MSLSPQERSVRRAALRRMNARQKLDYVFAYYKLPILLGAILLCVLASVIYRQTTKKEAVLYAAMVNVSVGESLEDALTTQFIESSGANARKQEVYLYRDLYISDDASVVNHEYAYASRLKLLGAINSKRLDLVLMNREGYDLLSRSGYLLELPELLSRNALLLQKLNPYLTDNTVILEDNAIEYNLNEASSYHALTESAVNGIDVSGLPVFRSAGFPDAVYLGVIANCTRAEWALRYLAYLTAPL